MNNPPALLEYSPLSEYKAPSERSAEAARRFRRIWRAVTSALESRKKSEDGAGEDLDQPDHRVPAEALPRFDLDAAADALAAALDGWPALDSAAKRLRVVVGPPGSHAHEVVAELARRQGWRELEPPSRADLLERPEVIRERSAELESGVGAPAVVCQLERWLLRGESALPSTRLLLEALRSRPSPVLIGCDSWAWSFLDSAAGMEDLFGQPLALAPLDGDKLARWLGPPMAAHGLTCRPRDNREEAIFETAPNGGANGGSDARSSRVLTRLAAAARGNPGVALELWSRAVRLATDQEGTVWTLPPADAEIVLPERLEIVHDFVLHAILLHGGLDRELLLEVLPFPRHDLLRRIQDLSDAGVLIESGVGDGRELSIPLSAYVPVRQRLAGEGFLVDGF